MWKKVTGGPEGPRGENGWDKEESCRERRVSIGTHTV